MDSDKRFVQLPMKLTQTSKQPRLSSVANDPIVTDSRTEMRNSKLRDFKVWLTVSS